MEQDREVKRILWKCRRGTKELDLILLEFVKAQYSSLPMEEKLQFRSLLEIEDPLLIDWLCNQIKPDIHGMEQIVSRILSAHKN